MWGETVWTCFACGRTEKSSGKPPTCLCGVEQSWDGPPDETPGDSPTPRAVLASTLESVDIPRRRTGEHRFDELLEGGFALGTAVLVYGRRGSGKSRLCYRWATRTVALIAHAELGVKVARSIVHTSAGQLGNAYLLPDLEGWEREAERVGARAVVLDSLAATRRPIAVMRRAQAWASSHNAVVWAIQHATKRNDVRGPAELAHWADYEIRTAKDEASTTRVEVLKSRVSPTGSVVLGLLGYSNEEPPAPSAGSSSVPA